MSEKSAIAGIVRLVFEARRNREVHPDGTFDSTGRWYPSDIEDAGCTATIARPRRAYPYSYMLHCRTRKHCEKLVDQGLSGHPVPHDVAEVLRINTLARSAVLARKGWSESILRRLLGSGHTLNNEPVYLLNHVFDVEETAAFERAIKASKAAVRGANTRRRKRIPSRYARILQQMGAPPEPPKVTTQENQHNHVL